MAALFFTSGEPTSTLVAGFLSLQTLDSLRASARGVRAAVDGADEAVWRPHALRRWHITLRAAALPNFLAPTASAAAFWQRRLRTHNGWLVRGTRKATVADAPVVFEGPVVAASWRADVACGIIDRLVNDMAPRRRGRVGLRRLRI
jgi:hypothetical protein